MPATELFTATHKSAGPHGLAGWWWFLSNGLDPSHVCADQEVACDPEAMTATYDVFTTNLVGHRIITDEGMLRHPVTAPIKYLPSIYGLQNAVSA